MMGRLGFGGFGWIGMILGMVVMVAVLIGLVLLVVWAVRRMGGSTSPQSAPTSASQSALDIAQTRYAKGEINRDEYQQIVADLKK
jgi:putative membrane protein